MQMVEQGNFEGGPRPGNPVLSQLVQGSEVPLHESPLIPNRFVPEPDAYELAIARRQVLTLSGLQQSQSTEKSEPTSLSSETEPNFSNNPPMTEHSTTPTPPTIVENFHREESNGIIWYSLCIYNS